NGISTVMGRAGTGSREAAPRVLVRAANGLPRRESLEAEGMEGARGERLARDDRRQRPAHGRAELEALAVAARQHVQALDAGQRPAGRAPAAASGAPRRWAWGTPATPRQPGPRAPVSPPLR